MNLQGAQPIAHKPAERAPFPAGRDVLDRKAVSQAALFKGCVIHFLCTAIMRTKNVAEYCKTALLFV
jgi:hypothetical protein